MEGLPTKTLKEVQDELKEPEEDGLLNHLVPHEKQVWKKRIRPKIATIGICRRCGREKPLDADRVCFGQHSLNCKEKKY